MAHAGVGSGPCLGLTRFLHTGVVAETRYCMNCRAELPPRATVCPSCDVYAGDVYDGRAPAHVRARRRRRAFLSIALLFIAGGTAALLYWRPELIERFVPQKYRPPVVDTSTPVRVVGDRPGGARRGSGASITEPEAILRLRRALVTSSQPTKTECLAITSQGFRQGAYNLTAFDTCEGTRLGQWRVSASGEIERR